MMKSAVLLVAFALLATVYGARLIGGGSDAIPDQFIVVMKKGITLAERDAHADVRVALGDDVIAKFDIGTLVGYSVRMKIARVEEMLNDQRIEYIEQDQVVRLNDETIEQPGATWGINRVSQQRLPLDGTYRYFSTAGNGVDAYIIDTGIYLEHNEFQGRAVWGINTVPGEQDIDCHGHGTHVAGTVGGLTYGVAKKVSLFAVKVLSCSGSGSWTGVIQGIEGTTKSYQSRKRPSVANMSLGGGISATTDAAVAASVAAGVNYAIAAGNSNADACNYSPARVQSAITVGATTNTDNRASYSNWGTCLDVFGPGSSITSAWIGTPTSINTISGTSMAAPHVCGAVAVHLGHDPEAGDTNAIHAWVAQTATQGVVINPGTNSPNRMLFSPFSEDAPHILQ